MINSREISGWYKPDPIEKYDDYLVPSQPKIFEQDQKPDHEYFHQNNNIPQVQVLRDRDRRKLTPCEYRDSQSGANNKLV
jgi:hypothetical protein